MSENSQGGAPSQQKDSSAATAPSHDDGHSGVGEAKRSQLYKPLNKNEIRVLVLIPGKPEDPLEGFFVTVQPDRAEEVLGCFYALSYNWGDQSNPVTMKLHGHDLKHNVLIGRNLASALVSIRAPPGPTSHALWVDAMCINQKDDLEKTEQVQRMPDIYESARKAFIWLGDEFKGVKEAFAWLRDLHWSKASSFEELNALLTTEIAAALAKLLSLPWWRRVWIIQEATVCKDAVVMCGCHEIEFSYFITLANVIQLFVSTTWISRQESPYSLLMPAAKDLLMLAEFQSGWRPCGGGVHFMELEALVRRTYLRVLATDPRDRFYALTGISTPQDMVALMPDYNLNRDAVFLKATIHLIRKTSSIDILQLGENLYHSAGDPSWLPGWDQGPRSSTAREPFKGPCFGEGSETSSDSSDASEGMCFSLTTSEDLRVLTVSGAVIGKLILDSQFQPEEDKFQPPSCIFRWLEILNNLNNTFPNPYNNSCGLMEAFVRALVAGNEILAPQTDPPDMFPLRNVFNIWATMVDPETNVPDAWRRLQENRPGVTFDPLLTPAATLRRHALDCLHRRSFVITANGYIGLAPDDAREGDIAALIAGSSTPICLRPENGHFRWVGAMYLHDVMRGGLAEHVMRRRQGASVLTKFEIH